MVLFRGDWSDCSSEDWPFDVDTELTALWEPLSSVCREVLCAWKNLIVNQKDIKWMCVCWGGYVQCALCDTGEVVVKSTVYITMSGMLHSTRTTYPNTSYTTSTHSHLFLELQDNILQLSFLFLTLPREGGQLRANTRQLLVPHWHQLLKVVLKGG